MRRVDRRELVAGVLATSAVQLTPSLGSATSYTTHTFELGEFEISVFSDGHLTIPARLLARNVSEAEIKAWLGQTVDTVSPPANVTLVRTPTEVILFDVGAGPHFMPGAGKLAASMEVAGVDRNAVTKVVFTHAHPDHLWGTLDDFDNEPMFPNASYVITGAEWNFWMADDTATKLPEDRQNFAPGAKRNLSRIKDKLRTIEPGADIANGIRAVDTSGHTAGHISVEIVSGNEAVLVLADALTHPTISFAHPDWSPAADHHDADRAIATRKSLLDRLASDSSRVIGFHLPFPGLGRVERHGLAYRYVPTA